MRSNFFLLLAVALTSSFTCTKCLASDEDEIKSALEGWSSAFSVDDRKADSYIRAAQILQNMGKDKACAFLRACAAKYASKRFTYIPITDLCRLVFKAKQFSTFSPRDDKDILCLGGTGLKDWLIAPFEVVDGVPFLIGDEYEFHFGKSGWGSEKSTERYLEYCIKECDWNDVKFVPKTQKEKELALEKLLESKKWKKPLSDWEKDRLRAQIK